MELWRRLNLVLRQRRVIDDHLVRVAQARTHSLPIRTISARIRIISTLIRINGALIPIISTDDSLSALPRHGCHIVCYLLCHNVVRCVWSVALLCLRFLHVVRRAAFRPLRVALHVVCLCCPKLPS